MHPFAFFTVAVLAFTVTWGILSACLGSTQAAAPAPKQIPRIEAYEMGDGVRCYIFNVTLSCVVLPLRENSPKSPAGVLTHHPTP
jgi:hypothetical protein